MTDQKPRRISYHAVLPFRYSAGRAASRFFAELRDHKRIMATRCSKCGKAYVPPRPVCGECFMPLEEWVEVGPGGTLVGFTVVYFPGTELYRSAHQYGMFKNDWKSMSLFVEPCFVPYGLTKEKMLAYRRKAILQFYLRPRIIFSYLRRITTISRIKALLKGGITILKLLLAKR